MTEIHIDLQRLKAMQLLAAKADVRPYLMGVCVEATKTETRLVATQGHIAGYMRHCNPSGMPNDMIDGYIEFILPNEVIDKIKLSKSVSNIGTVLIKLLDSTTGQCSYTLRLWDGTLMPFQPVAGKFPDLRRVFPAEVNGEAANFNPYYVETFRKVATALGVSKNVGGGVWFQFNGEGASRVILDGQANFAGLIMAVRDTGDKVKAMKPMTFPPRGVEVQGEGASAAEIEESMQ